MYNIAILGTENSHAMNFAQLIKGIFPAQYGLSMSDFNIVGIYGYDENANKAITEKCGADIYVADSPDEFLGKVDSVIVTARHGDNHLKYAEKYIKAGLPVWIDKPVTCTEEDARKLVSFAENSGSIICGGSMGGKVPDTLEMKKLCEDTEKGGALMGGCVSAPVNMTNPYGDFFFYSQHLIEIMMKVFGYGIKSVYAQGREKTAVAICNYENFDVTANYGGWTYGVSVFKEKAVFQKELNLFSNGTYYELLEYKNMLDSGKMPMSYADFVAPVFVLNAINRSFKSGIIEKVNTL